MSAPNEPGFPRGGESPGGGNGSPAPGAGRDNGSAGRVGTEGGDVPPWQRGRPSRPPQGGPARPEPARSGSPAHAPGAEARNTSRFPVSGSAPTEETHAPAAPVRTTEAPRPEAYASELPDLSGPVPRPPQRKPAGERPSTEPPSRSASAPRTQVGHRPARGPVRASMQIRRVDPWSALKVSLVLSVALFFVWMIAVAFLYLVLGGMGVWDKLNSNVGDLLTSTSGGGGGELVSSGTIFGGAALIGLVNIVILTAMATAGAFIYNLTTDLVGGVEVTLADRD
ncbi:DUF3566 domain-containing protein [Mycolicibacterium litorale]|uniref:DUF3566 domain-containing protein n=1 Tax=Mycolicibacterium litorale TaxID=758802 RepID=A0AAD1MWK0_9MYCO|nr:DUF3566 domain-containing protein [Mycolicibacterium litorale]MCV7417358.1 DUF3566 domain-containing protein [Mycolicibacterium litorale]TDY05147.1 transmembrane protein DUF3566 [Mycolicibacterium litorale]BBY18582.1 hypothetical protein MLIT_41740 [Mycolicibacterium litorale]